MVTKSKSSKAQSSGVHSAVKHLIPPAWFADDYVSREFHGQDDIFHTDTDLLKYAHDVRHNTLMFGPTGPGKTSCVYAYAAGTCGVCYEAFPRKEEDGEMQPCETCSGTEGIPVAYVACNGAVDPSTMFVRPTIKATQITVEKVMAMAAEISKSLGVDWSKADMDTQLRIMETASQMLGVSEEIEMIESDVVLVIRYGGIVLLDEGNFMPPRVSAVIHGLLDKRRTITLAEKGNEAISAHPNCQVVLTYNPDYEGTKPLNEAFKNRFALKMAFDYDPDIEMQFITNIPVLHLIADKARTAHDNGDLETPFGPNMMVEFEMLAADLGVDFAIANLMNAFHAEERSAVQNFIEHFKADLLREAAAYRDEMNED